MTTKNVPLAWRTSHERLSVEKEGSHNTLMWAHVQPAMSISHLKCTVTERDAIQDIHLFFISVHSDKVNKQKTAEVK
jgi:hypothetical protein